MNAWMAVAVTAWTLVALSVARSWLGRRGWVLNLDVTFRRPRRAPRMPEPKPGNVVIPVQLSAGFFEMARQGLAGITTVHPVGDGETWTLTVQETTPRGE